MAATAVALLVLCTLKFLIITVLRESYDDDDDDDKAKSVRSP
jgi:hypothetical protein